MAKPELRWFIENGCELTRPDMRLLVGVYELSHGEPCRECNCKDTCPAWPKLGIVGRSLIDVSRPRCHQCASPLNMTKVERRGGKCSCGATVGAMR